MKCPRCTHQHPPDVRFCNDYGQRVGTLCPGCNTVNPTESRYYHHYGPCLTKTNGFFPGEKSSRPRLSDVEKVEGGYEFDPKAPYAHPYYWAPFILMGNFFVTNQRYIHTF